MSNSVPEATPDQVRGSLFTPPERVDLDAIAQHFIKQVGGAAAFANLLHKEYLGAEAGSPTRARIMDMVLRTFTKLDAKAVPDDLSTMTEEDLDRLLQQKMTRIGAPNGNPGHAAAPEKTPGPSGEAKV